MSDESFPEEDVDSLIAAVDSGLMAAQWDWMVANNFLSRPSPVIADPEEAAPVCHVWSEMPQDPPEGIRARLRRLYEQATGVHRAQGHQPL